MSDKDNKREEIKVRVATEMKKQVQALAKSSGESEAFVIREALRSFFEVARKPKQPPNNKQ